MGKHFWTKHIDDEQDHKQPGCISGLINVLDYHHWNSSTRKMTHHNKYAVQTGDWSPNMNLPPRDSCEVEKLLDEKQSPFLNRKRARGNITRSLKSRIKALVAEEMYKESKTKEGFLFKSRLQRTYSIHHLESLDDSINKICTDWKNPIIFIPSKVENSSPRSSKPADLNEASGQESEIFSAANIGLLEKTDFLDILKIDKELFVRNLQISDESVTRFSHNNNNASKGKVELRKSRSFPDVNFLQRLKFKPSKLADKQKEIWSFPKLQADSVEKKLGRLEEKDQDSLIKGEIQQRNEWMAPSDIINVDVGEEATVSRVGENTARNYSQSRSSSLNESLDKYARLFESSYGTDAKLNLSRSLRLTNENGHASAYSRRIRSRSMSNSHSFNSHLNLGVAGDDALLNDSFVIAEDDSSRQDEEKMVRLVASGSEKEPLDLIETESADYMQRREDYGLHLNESSEKREDLEEEAPKPKSDDFSCLPQSTDGSDPCSISDSCTIPKEKLSASGQLEISQEELVQSVGHAMDSGYVRLILDQSGIAKDASERPWHASDQPLSPQILEDVEALCPHEHDQLTSWHDFCSSCWQHQMLFDLVNETLIQTYDFSLPYYPKPLSSSCHVRPFPVGNHIVEEVSTSIDKLLNLRTDEKQSLDRIMAHDLRDDYRWMNLQFESECIGLELEDLILDALVEELVCS